MFFLTIPHEMENVPWLLHWKMFCNTIFIGPLFLLNHPGVRFQLNRKLSYSIVFCTLCPLTKLFHIVLAMDDLNSIDTDVKQLTSNTISDIRPCFTDFYIYSSLGYIFEKDRPYPWGIIWDKNPSQDNRKCLGMWVASIFRLSCMLGMSKQVNHILSIKMSQKCTSSPEVTST